MFLSGVQALVRVLLDQHRADVRAGLRTATLVSGYPGSPLAGFVGEVGGLGALAAEYELILQPAVNEELAATAVWGSQLAGTLPGPRFDGVQPPPSDELEPAAPMYVNAGEPLQ